MRNSAGRRGLYLFIASLLIYSACPPFTSYDSYWTVPTALSILQHGDANVDEFPVPQGAVYATECVPPSGRSVPYNPESGCDGHLYNRFPVAVSILALPVIVVLKVIAPLIAPLVHSWANVQVASFLEGDFVAGHAVVELLTASLYSAITVLLMFRLLVRFLAPNPATLLTILFAFGTAEWSVASRSLLQHGLSAFLSTIALNLLVRGLEKPSLLPLTAIPLAIACAVRPTNVVSLGLVALFLTIHHRQALARFVAYAIPVAAVFVWFSLATRHALLPAYFTGPPASPVSAWAGALLQVFSPSRGLLIFTPVFLFAIAGAVIAIRTRWCWPLTPYLAAIPPLHLAVVSMAWPGHCYGSRYFADITPWLVFFLIPAVQHWRSMVGSNRTMAASAFAALAVWGVFTHARGATSVAAQEWSSTPVSVDAQPSRVWDWSDPQFLRGLR